LFQSIEAVAFVCVAPEGFTFLDWPATSSVDIGLAVPMPTLPHVVVVIPPALCNQQLFCKFVAQLVTVCVVPTDDVFNVTVTEAGFIARTILLES
jgi:hypothetical protein